MNRIRESMEGIRASRALKADTLHYLEGQRARHARPLWSRPLPYALAALCLLLLLGTGAHVLYKEPAFYISMDVNPSIELAVNRYGRVVAADAYNQDGRDILQHLSLKNKPYLQAVTSLLEDEVYNGYLAQGAALVFAIVSDSPGVIEEDLAALDTGAYEVLFYISDSYCMQEAHRYGMSVGKYSACQELAEYDQSVTVEECRELSMGEIQDRIEGCRQHQEPEHGEGHGDGHDGSDESHVGSDESHVSSDESHAGSDESHADDDESHVSSDESHADDDRGNDTGRGDGGRGHHGGRHD